MNTQKFELFTSEVYARRYLNVGYDCALIRWAENMVLSGFNSDHLNILLGEIAPFNGFEIDEFLDRIQVDLGIPRIGSRAEAIEIAATAYIKRFLLGLSDSGTTMFTLAEIYTHDEQSESISDFYHLHYAAVDLGMEEYQFHWPEAYRHNIERIIKTRCTEWMTEHELETWKKYEWLQNV